MMVFSIGSGGGVVNGGYIMMLKFILQMLHLSIQLSR
jgi:hypothetical protein